MDPVQSLHNSNHQVLASFRPLLQQWRCLSTTILATHPFNPTLGLFQARMGTTRYHQAMLQRFHQYYSDWFGKESWRFPFLLFSSPSSGISTQRHLTKGPMLRPKIPWHGIFEGKKLGFTARKHGSFGTWSGSGFRSDGMHRS